MYSIYLKSAVYIIGELARKDSIALNFNNFEQVWALYPIALNNLRKIIEVEKTSLAGQKDKFSTATFLTGNKPKKMLEKDFS
jgi:hypothetical protein